MWVRLRGLRSMGFHFRRQAPVGRYIVDFLCLKHRLIVEIDGGQHGLAAHATQDALRDAALVSLGFRIVRFWNSDVDANIDGVVETILDRLKAENF